MYDFIAGLPDNHIKVMMNRSGEVSFLLEVSSEWLEQTKVFPEKLVSTGLINKR